MKLLLAAFVALKAAAQVSLGENQVFAAKDSLAFTRKIVEGAGFDASPVSLAIIDEKLFFVNEGRVVADDDETTEVVWDFLVNGDPVLRRTTRVESDKTFVLEVGLGLSGTINPENHTEEFFTSKKKGVNLFSIDIISPQTSQVVEESRVFQIAGFWSFFPLLLIVALALLSRNVYIAMFFGIWVGSIIIAEGNIGVGLKDLFDVHVIPSVTDDSNFRTITFTLFLGGFLAMIKKAGGQDGFSNFISKFATSAKKTQLAAVTAGIGLFFDDYSSVLILGASFKNLMDKFYVSREKLAFVADATSAPIASIAPISSWIAFELSLITVELEGIRTNSGFDSKDDLLGDYPFFLSTIPSRYYPFLMLTVQVTLIIAGIEFGPMLYAERKTRLGKRTDGGDGRMEIPLEQDFTTPDEDTPKRAWNFFIPLGFFLSTLVASLINIGIDNIDIENELLAEEDQIGKTLRDIMGNTNSFEALVYTTMGASIFALFFYLFQFKKNGKIVVPTKPGFIDAIDCRLKSSADLAAQEGVSIQDSRKLDSQVEEMERPIMYFTEGVNIWVEGFKNLVPAILILCMAFTIKSIVTGLATDRLFTDIILSSDIDAGALPTIVFVVSAFLALATGTSFGTMSIMFPLVSFATFESSNGDIDTFTVALSSIMAGAVFGDHSSPISDTTILASIGAGCQIGAHVYTQLPYALWAGLFSIIFGTLPAGYGANSALMLVVSIVMIVFFTLFVSAPIVAETGRLDMFSELVLKYTKSETLQKFKDQTVLFAQENPELINEEPAFYLARSCPMLASLCSKVNVQVPFGQKKYDTRAEIDAIVNDGGEDGEQGGEGRVSV